MDLRILVAVACFALACLVIWARARMGDGPRILLGGALLLVISVVFAVTYPGRPGR